MSMHYVDRSGKVIDTLDDFYDALHGKVITHRGIQGTINVARFKDLRGTRVYINPTPRGKRSPQYKKDKALLRDDFDIDVTESDALFTDIAKKAGLREKFTKHEKTR